MPTYWPGLRERGLGVPPTLARILRSTNTIASMMEIRRDHAANVKCWRDKPPSG